jgi:hypothetical protein
MVGVGSTRRVTPRNHTMDSGSFPSSRDMGTDEFMANRTFLLAKMDITG